MSATTTRRRVAMRRRPARGDPERGMVTAEIATVLPTLVVLLLAAVWSVGLASAQLRCSDAAREAARAAARGEDISVVRDVALAVAPEGAAVEIDHADGMVLIEVHAPVALPPPLGSMSIGPTVRGRAVAVEEAR